MHYELQQQQMLVFEGKGGPLNRERKLQNSTHSPRQTLEGSDHYVCRKLRKFHNALPACL